MSSAGPQAAPTSDDARAPALPRNGWVGQLIELRWWLLSALVYFGAMIHLEGIDPARPEKVRLVKHALVSAVGAFALPLLGWLRRRYTTDKLLQLALWVFASLFMISMSRGFVVSHIDDAGAMSVLRKLVKLALPLTLIAWPLSHWGARLPKALRLAPWLCAIALLLFARQQVLAVSPDPRIDVFTLAREASTVFWRGENPYAADYSNYYVGTKLDLGYSPGYNYFPLVLLSNVLSHKLTGDVRAAYVLAEILCAIFIWRFARALGWSLETACALTLLWCTNSLSFQVVEKWNDSLPLAATFATVAFLADRRWIAAGIAFGLGACTKQYAPLAFFPIALWLWRIREPGSAKRFIVSAACSAGVLFLPFLLNHGDWLIARTLLHFSRTPFRDDSISFLNLSRIFLGFGEKSFIIRVAPFAGLLGGLAVAAAAILRMRPAGAVVLDARDWHARVHALVLSLLCVWAAFFHTIKQSFLNYHYFYFSFGVLLLASIVERSDEADGARPPAAAAD